MESLNETVSEKPRGPSIERVTIDKIQSEKLNTWLTQLNENSKGFLTLTKSELVNFLIADHKFDLSPKEIQQIRARHYDPIRHMNWITQELKAAIANGDMTAVAALQSEIKGIELTVIAKATNGTDSSNIPASAEYAPRRRKKRIAKTDNNFLSENLSEPK